MVAIQQCHNTHYDSKLNYKMLNSNDLVLLYDSHFKNILEKFKMHWLGPNKVLKSYPNGSVEL